MEITTEKQLEELGTLGQDNPSPAALLTRAAFVKLYLKDVPDAYTRYLKATDNMALLQTAADGIRAVYADDVTRATGKILPPVDWSKFTPEQKVELGLRSESLAKMAATPPRAASAKVDTSKMSALQKIVAGIRAGE